VDRPHPPALAPARTVAAAAAPRPAQAIPGARVDPSLRTTRHRAGRANDAEAEDQARAQIDTDLNAALARLRQHGPLLAKHEETSLPCLCRRCLHPENASADAEGTRYVRDFVVAHGRTLFYWMPEELLPEAKQVRASMRSAVRDRLSHTKRGVKINPFTGERLS
jgi:hypothetical protein